MADIITFLFLTTFGFVALTIGIQALLSCTSNNRPANQITYNNWEQQALRPQRQTFPSRRIRVKPVPVPVQVRRLQ